MLPRRHHRDLADLAEMGCSPAVLQWGTICYHMQVQSPFLRPHLSATCVQQQPLNAVHNAAAFVHQFCHALHRLRASVPSYRAQLVCISSTMYVLLHPLCISSTMNVCSAASFGHQFFHVCMYCCMLCASAPAMSPGPPPPNRSVPACSTDGSDAVTAQVQVTVTFALRAFHPPQAADVRCYAV
jgi:hypothetical protein